MLAERFINTFILFYYGTHYFEHTIFFSQTQGHTPIFLVRLTLTLSHKDTMKHVSILLCILSMALSELCPLFANDTCIISPIDSGFGAGGSYTMKQQVIKSNTAPTREIYIFQPENYTQKSPLIFLSHRYGTDSPWEYMDFISHIVSKGYTVIYPPHRNLIFTRAAINAYDYDQQAYEQAFEAIITTVDTTRIGLVGHGFGAGILPSLAWDLLRTKQWGSQGAFLYTLSPWYLMGAKALRLKGFPDQLKVVVQVFEDDNYNSPYIALDLYENIGGPGTEKTFLFLPSDEDSFCGLQADFFTPLSKGAFLGETNAHDYYGIYRIFDLLAAYTFTKDSTVKALIFPSKELVKLPMGMRPDGSAVTEMIAAKNPEPLFKKKVHVNMWKSIRNPRTDITKTGKVRKTLRKSVKVASQLSAKSIQNKRAKRDSVFALFKNPIDSGFGAPGPYKMLYDSADNGIDVRNQNWRLVHFFYPDKPGPKPTIILCHGYMSQIPDQFNTFITFVVSKGYAVIYPVFSPFPNVSDSETVHQKYAAMHRGIDTAYAHWPQHIDTSRIGFFGQSFGAGAIPSVAYTLITKKKWGTRGAFMFLSAPWFVHGITMKQLRDYPSHVKLIVQVYNDDRVNDHQLAVFLYNTIGIDKSEKDYITLYSDSYNGYSIQADHFTAFSPSNTNGDENFHDYYGIYRLIDALGTYAFTGDSTAKNIALGNGSQEQRYMGHWDETTPVRELSVTDRPRAVHPENRYFMTWSNKLNILQFK